MCGLLEAAAGFSIIGGVLGMGAEKKRASSDARAMQAEADVSDKNAALADMEVDLMGEQAKIDNYNVDTNLAIDVGRQRAAFAGGNVVLDVGTPLRVEQEAVNQASMEKQAMGDKRAVDIFMKRQEAEGLRDRARKLRAGIGQVSSAGSLAAASRLTGSLAQAAGFAMQAKR